MLTQKLLRLQSSASLGLCPGFSSSSLSLNPLRSRPSSAHLVATIIGPAAAAGGFSPSVSRSLSITPSLRFYASQSSSSSSSSSKPTPSQNDVFHSREGGVLPGTDDILYRSRRQARTPAQEIDHTVAQLSKAVTNPEPYGPNDDLLIYSRHPRWSVFSWRGSLLSLLVMAIIFSATFWYIQKQNEKRMKDVAVEVETFGKPDIGGSFELIDTKGNVVTDQTLLGKWWLLYFGFTNCPDICPMEMDKITKVISATDRRLLLSDASAALNPKSKGKQQQQQQLSSAQKQDKLEIVPVFVSVDPSRDTPAAIEEYLKDFHPRFLGLTGSSEQIKRICHKFRVYYSEPEKHGENDYLVDHSIITYLINPAGEFVQLYGKNFTPEEVTESVIKHMKNYAAGQDTSQLKRN